MADANTIDLDSLSLQELHEANRCRPCLFFTRKEDGCWKGDACDHCHICTSQQAKVRRNRITWQGRKLRRQKECVAKAEKLKEEEEEGQEEEDDDEEEAEAHAELGGHRGEDCQVRVYTFWL
ncbi:unnamed protein product [Effrenium voratum]|uniref:C3H1-type domain-containing protein n=1 Tax=Effrenium voratum TaxID=2562239 RepID=A0AA36NBQ1_9DINO|nr:unnamed protein product [Effrenium voratum]